MKSKKKMLTLATVLLLMSSIAFADDVSIDSDGNVTTGISNTNANLEVTGANEDGIVSTTTGTDRAAVYGEHSPTGNYGILGYDTYGVYGNSSLGWAGYFQGNVNVTGTLTVGGLTGFTEKDPVFLAWDRSTGISITESQISNLDHFTIGDETDPVFDASAASGITSGNITNWNTAYSWGAHSSAGYVTGVMAGTGLNGGGTSGDVTLDVDYAGTGSAVTAARSDHDHNALYYSQAQVDTIISALTEEYESRIQSVETMLPRTWKSEAEIVEIYAGNADDPQIAIDGSGNAVAVWYQNDGEYDSIWSNRYTAGGGWGTAELIETDNTSHMIEPQVAVDASGNAVAVWYQDGGTRSDIWSNHYTAGSGWGTAVIIETDNAGDADEPQVALDGSGNAVAVWYQYSGTRSDIWSNRYMAGSGWGTAELIETDNTSHAYYTQVAVDASGNATAVWQQHNGTRYNIWSNRYTAGSGWGTAELIETDNAGNADGPQVAVDRSGNAVAVWAQHDGTQYNIWSNRYTAGSGWGTAELIETDNAGNATLPQIAIDGSGNAVAVWYQYDGADSIWSNRYTAGSGWGTAELIETIKSHAYYPQVAVDLNGNATAVWQQYDGTRYNIWSNRYTAGSGWGTALLIESGSAGSAYCPQVAVHGSGDALAVWTQDTGTRYTIYSNEYTRY